MLATKPTIYLHNAHYADLLLANEAQYAKALAWLNTPGNMPPGTNMDDATVIHAGVAGDFALCLQRDLGTRKAPFYHMLNTLCAYIGAYMVLGT